GPLCSSAEQSSSKYNSRLSFHGFPSDPDLQRRWLVNIRCDNFKLTSHSKVCSLHFPPDQFHQPKTPGGRRMVKKKKGAVPVLFQWNNFCVQPGRASVWERVSRPEGQSVPVKVVTQHQLRIYGKSVFASVIAAIRWLYNVMTQGKAEKQLKTLSRSLFVKNKKDKMWFPFLLLHIYGVFFIQLHMWKRSTGLNTFTSQRIIPGRSWMRSEIIRRVSVRRQDTIYLLTSD
uniref:THAP domain-containing protein 1 n=1 Tax=Xiphophorus maculatus TaxID=8083 RepID=A0A3B5QAF1_XIPMA